MKGLLNFIAGTATQLSAQQQESGNVFSFVFEVPQNFTWKAGQHILLSVNGKMKPFSIASSPEERKIRITKSYRGESASAFKQALHRLSVGEKAVLRGPAGPMVLTDPNKHYVLLAQGIGITPFRAILKDATAKNLPHKITLLYVNTADEILFKSELDMLAKENSNITVVYISGKNSLTSHDIQVSTPDLGQAVFFLSGAPATIRDYTTLLLQLGVSKDQIKKDPFYGYK